MIAVIFLALCLDAAGVRSHRLGGSLTEAAGVKRHEIGRRNEKALDEKWIDGGFIDRLTKNFGKYPPDDGPALKAGRQGGIDADFIDRLTKNFRKYPPDDGPALKAGRQGAIDGDFIDRLTKNFGKYPPPDDGPALKAGGTPPDLRTHSATGMQTKDAADTVLKMDQVPQCTQHCVLTAHWPIYNMDAAKKQCECAGGLDCEKSECAYLEGDEDKVRDGDGNKIVNGRGFVHISNRHDFVNSRGRCVELGAPVPAPVRVEYMGKIVQC